MEGATLPLILQHVLVRAREEVVLDSAHRMDTPGLDGVFGIS